MQNSKMIEEIDELLLDLRLRLVFADGTERTVTRRQLFALLNESVARFRDGGADSLILRHVDASGHACETRLSPAQFKVMADNLATVMRMQAADLIERVQRRAEEDRRIRGASPIQEVKEVLYGDDGVIKGMVSSFRY